MSKFISLATRALAKRYFILVDMWRVTLSDIRSGYDNPQLLLLICP